MSLHAMRIDEIVRAARDRGASDVHLAVGQPAVLRIDGELMRFDPASLAAADLEAYAAAKLDQRAQSVFAGSGICDVGFSSNDVGALRLHFYRDRTGTRCAIRLLPSAAPSLESLDLPSIVRELALRRNGLLLVVGPTGSGKTTLLAAMVDTLNRNEARHIVILEEPIEYVHAQERSLLSQCEIGRDVVDLASAIHAVLRADPDVIVLGELREREAMRSALGAAETGHLVIASLHAPDAVLALDRIADSFPTDGRDAIRSQLAQTLVAVVGIQLIRRARTGGRRAAVELLIACDAVRHLVREGKHHQLRSTMQTGRAFGMQTMEMHLSQLFVAGEISAEVAVRAAHRPDELAKVSAR